MRRATEYHEFPEVLVERDEGYVAPGAHTRGSAHRRGLRPNRRTTRHRGRSLVTVLSRRPKRRSRETVSRRASDQERLDALMADDFAGVGETCQHVLAFEPRVP